MDLKYIIIPLFLLFIGRSIYAQSQYRQVVTQFEKSNPQMIDVRTPEEFHSGHNKNSINIPLDQLLKNLDKIDKKRPVLLVCRSGNRSGMAQKILKENGFSNVHNAGPWGNLP
ncbi:MAG: hypothetical protein Fur0010_20280 [Bdellovibrio sp.]